jgi:hypothetical protein
MQNRRLATRAGPREVGKFAREMFEQHTPRERKISRPPVLDYFIRGGASRPALSRCRDSMARTIASRRDIPGWRDLSNGYQAFRLLSVAQAQMKQYLFRRVALRAAPVLEP